MSDGIEDFVRKIKENAGKSQRWENEPGKDIFGAPLEKGELMSERVIFYGVRELIGLKGYSNISISAAEERTVADDDTAADDAFRDGIQRVEEIIGTERTAIIEAFEEDYEKIS